MLRNLVEVFQDRVTLPIEVTEIRTAIQTIGFQDRIILSARTLDTEVLRGTFYQWTERATLYGEPQLVTLVIYPENINICWQRLICAKEMVHVCDQQIAKTVDIEAIVKLAEKLLGPSKAEATDVTDVMALVDKLAQFQALDLLFPKAARAVAKLKLADNSKTLLEIAEWAKIPQQYVELALTDQWETISARFLSMHD